MDDQRLAGWLRDVELAPGAERQGALNAAAASLAQDVSFRGTFSLVLLAHGDHRSPSADSVADAVHAQDETAALRREDLETALTAAVAVVHGLEGESIETKAWLALSVLNARFAGLAPAIAELPDLALRALIEASEQLRERRALKLGKPGVAEALAAAEYATGDTTQAYHTDLRGVLDATEKGFTRALSALNRLVKALNRRLDGAEEELELLAWSFGEFSETAGKPFNEVPDAAAPIVLSLEVARATKNPVPLPSTRALLSRSLGTGAGKQTTLAKAIPAAVKLIDEGQLPDAEGHRLLPVLSAAKAHAEFGGNPNWTASMERWQIDPSQEVDALDLAEETVREILLTRPTE
jgi:hypothetical protein